MKESEKQVQNEALKFLIHVDSDYIGDDEEDIQKLSELFRRQWQTGTIVMPNYVCRVVIIDYYGRMCYEWTRPSHIVFDCPEKKKGWFW